MKSGAIALLVAGIVLMAAPAYAYVDPGTGGMLIQLVTGGVAGLLVVMRLYWSQIRGLFARRSPAERTRDPLQPHATPAEDDQV